MRPLILALLLSGCAPMGSTLQVVDETGCEIETYRQTERTLEFSCQ